MSQALSLSFLDKQENQSESHTEKKIMNLQKRNWLYQPTLLPFFLSNLRPTREKSLSSSLPTTRHTSWKKKEFSASNLFESVCSGHLLCFNRGLFRRLYIEMYIFCIACCKQRQNVPQSACVYIYVSVCVRLSLAFTLCVCVCDCCQPQR